MSDHFVVEANRKLVGVAVSVRGGFQVVTSDPDYKQIETETFSSARSIARRVAEIELTQSESAPCEPRTLH